MGSSRAEHVGRRRGPLRLGRQPQGPRRRHLHRPAGPGGRRAGGVPSRGGCGRARHRATFELRGRGPDRGHGSRASPGHGEPTAPDRRDRGRGRVARGALGSGNAPVPDRRSDRGGRGAPPPIPLPRSPPARDDDDPADAAPDERDHARAHAVPRFPRGGDADARPLDAGGCPRLPRAVSPVAGELLRAPAVAAAAQAAPDGRRPGPVLPDRPLPPRRGASRRSGLRVHAARHRDVVRRTRRTSSR